MLKILHTADWQIGSKFTSFDPEDAYALFEQRFKVVENIAQYAATNNIDIVLVAGDVFDAQTVNDRTIMRMFNAMKAYAGPWVLISGNHDAALSESLWDRAQRLGCIPDNVILALENKLINIDELNLQILPAPLSQRHTSLDATQWFDDAELDQNKFHVGIAHGSVQGILDDAITNNLINIDRPAIKNLDYLALGDWHGTFKAAENCWYSGTPETDRFRNNDSGNILVVQLDAKGSTPKVEKINMGEYKWVSLDFEILIPSDVDVFINKLQDFNQNNLVDINISGSLSLIEKQKIHKAIATCRAATRALKINEDNLKIQATHEDIQNLNVHGYVAQAVQMLQENNETQALLTLAEIIMETKNEA